MNEYSLSDLAAATRGIDNNDFGSNGIWWLAILFLFGMGGFGGNFNNRNCGPVTEADLCSAMNFNDLQNAVGRLSDQNQNQTERLSNGISTLGYEMQGNVLNLGRDMALSQANLSQQMSTNAANLSQQLASCCCDTQRALDGINYNNAINTASINANIEAKFAALEKSNLEQRIADQAAQIQQLRLEQQMCGVVRYPNSFVYNAGSSPFCGYNNYCNCNNV